VGSPEVIPFYCVLQALRPYQAKDLLLWDRPDNSVHAFYCVLHALGQYRTNRTLLWDRPDLCLNVLSGHQGNTDRCLGGLAVNVFIVFFSVLFQRLVRADPILMSLHVLLARRPARRLRVCMGCYSQSASYRLTTFRPAAIGNAEVSQTDELLLCDRPDSCFLLCSTRFGPISVFAIMFYTHWGHTRVRSCFCGLVRIHVSYHPLYALA